MTETFYRTGSHKVDRTTYGGTLSSFDFDGHHTMATMAQRIISDFNFDKKCKRNTELRNENKNITKKEKRTRK